MRAWLLVLVACDPPNAPPGFDHIDEIEVEARVPRTDAAIDELADAVPAIAFGFAPHTVLGMRGFDDPRAALVALGQLARYSATHPAAPLIVTLHPQEEVYLMHGGRLDHDELVLAPLIANARVAASPERPAVAPRVLDHLTALAPALAGDALVWSSGELSADGTLRAFDPTPSLAIRGTVDDPLSVRIASPPGHHRRLIARIAGGMLVLDTDRRTATLVVIAADGSERASERIHGVTELAISPARSHVAVAAHRDGMPALFHIAVPSLAVTELDRTAIDGCVKDVGIDDDGAAIAYVDGGYDPQVWDQGVRLYDGRADPHLAPPNATHGYDAVADFDARSIALVRWDLEAHARRYRFVEIDRATNTERVVFEPHDGRNWYQPLIVRAGGTWYARVMRERRWHVLSTALDAIDANGTPHLDILRDAQIDAVAAAPDGRLAVHAGGVLRIFKDAALIAAAPLDGTLTDLAFAR